MKACVHPLAEMKASYARVGLALWLMLAGWAPLIGQDPFYLSRLREGEMAYRQRDFAEATRLLELACFGFLEDPPLLAEGLSRLALAQAALGDDDGYRTTYQRLVEIEERFAAYSEAPLDPELRAAIEASLERMVPADVLALSPTFGRIVAPPESSSRDSEAAPDRRGERELEQRAADDEPDLASLLELSELRFRDGKPRAAAELAARALEIDPESSRARCLRAASLASRRQRCEVAVLELTECDESTTDALFALSRLRCDVALERWQPASDFLAVLDPQIRQEKSIAKLVRTVEKRLAQPGRSVEPEAATAEGVQPDAVTAPQAAEPSIREEEANTAAASSDDLFEALLNRLRPAEASQLAEARELVVGANSLAAVERALELAEGIANSHPDEPEAQHFAAELAYRAARWEQALAYFQRGGDPGDGQPVRLFYLAVSAFEAGETELAASVLRRCRSRLPDTAFVKRYTERILPGS